MNGIHEVEGSTPFSSTKVPNAPIEKGLKLVKLEDIQSTWKGIKKGDPVKLIRDVYQRMDGTPYGGIYYEPPGHLIAKRDTIGHFSAKTPQGVLVYFNNGAGSILGLVLDTYAIEKHNVRVK